jgi:hypothetical protein
MESEPRSTSRPAETVLPGDENTPTGRSEPSGRMMKQPDRERGGVTAKRAWFLLSVSALGVGAALLGALLLMRTRTYFPVPPLPPDLASQVQPFQPLPAEVNDFVNAMQSQTAYRNTALSFGLLALCVVPIWSMLTGRFLGGGLLRGFFYGLALAGPVGIIAGLAGIAMRSFFPSSAAEGDPTFWISVSQACCWVVFSQAMTFVSIWLAKTWRLFPMLFLSTTIAATLATIVSQILATLLTPMAIPDLIIPDTTIGNAAFAGLGVLLPGLAAAMTLVSFLKSVGNSARLESH